jgi:hypothetical protein
MADAAPLQADLIDLLRATRAAERDIFASVPLEERDAAIPGGVWTAKDVMSHLAAWRAIEARRLEGLVRADDPLSGAPIDESNAALQARSAAVAWDAVAADADASVEALSAAILRSSFDALCECDGTAAGIGVNGVNHALGHLGEIAERAGCRERWDRFAAEVESILRRGHLPPNDAGLLLYNLACDRALHGELDEARRLLPLAFARRHDLLATAATDPDLEPIRDEIGAMAAAAWRRPAEPLSDGL